MKRALIISDTHGLTEEVAHVVSLNNFDISFHCGDFCVDETLFPFHKMKMVKGNNDFDSDAPEEQIVEWEGILFFITHGHKYNVNRSLMNLKYKAEEYEADVVLFGHTHFPLCIEEDGVIFVNPGSLRQPRGFSVPTFVLLQVEEIENGKTLSFHYFDAELKEVNSLGSTFDIIRKS
jgi:putative phosphoesterase